MPKTIVSGNLNEYGNLGQFETDRSTWGFSDVQSNSLATRSSAQQTAGLYSAHVVKDSLVDNRLLVCQWTSTFGKKYLVKAKVRVPTATPPGADADKITLKYSATNNYLALSTMIEHTEKTVLQAKDTWVDIEVSVQHSNAVFSPYVERAFIWLDGTVIDDGEIYIDQFEVYEYIGTSDPDPEPEPEPDATDNVFHSKNPITLGKTASLGWEVETNYRLYCDVRVEDVADSGTYVSKLKTELPPNTDGQVVFYQNEAFRDAFNFTPPTLNQNTIVRLTDRIKRFKSFTGELIDTEVTPGALDESAANLVLFGGIDKFRWPSLAYLTSYIVTNKKFLTWAPVQKHVDRLQEDYLNFWIYSEDIAELQLQIKAYFDDDTNETDIATSLSPVTYRSLYQIPAGPVNSGATLINPAKNLTHYELTLLDQDDVAVSETRTYYISSIRHPLTRFFMFLNSLGAFEVLRFTGQAERETEYVREVVQKFLPHNYAASDGEFASNNNTLQPKDNYSSGHIKGRMAEAWHEYMQDFLLSSRIYHITDGRRLPVNIVAGSWSKADQDYQRFIRFDVKPGYDDQSFTPSGI